jgi:hypothetical protein
VGTHWTTNWNVPWTEYLDALAYDGVSAHLVDSLILPSTWPYPLLVSGEDILIGRADTNYWTTNSGPSYLETWTLSGTGKFNQIGTIGVASPVNVLANFPGMLAAQEIDSSVTLLDETDPAYLRVIGHGTAPGCLWFDLNHADGDASRGVWLPLGAFGVGRIPVGQ